MRCPECDSSVVVSKLKKSATICHNCGYDLSEDVLLEVKSSKRRIDPRLDSEFELERQRLFEEEMISAYYE
jgi:transcription initiation factor TFIIIB Brf1 subunit/transcription initiation factor TFIIB